MSFTILLVAVLLFLGIAFTICCICDSGISHNAKSNWCIFFSISFILPVIMFFSSFFYESIQHLGFCWTHPFSDIIDVQRSLRHYPLQTEDLSEYFKNGYEIAWKHYWHLDDVEETILIRKPKNNIITYEHLVKEN